MGVGIHVHRHLDIGREKGKEKRNFVAIFS